MEPVTALQTIEHGPRDATVAVIWLHGLGADGHDFEPIVPELRLPAELPVRFIFPHAPIRPVTINMGQRMRAWYDIYGFDGRHEDEEGIRASARAVGDLVEREIARGVPSSRIVVAGFSQGAAMALHLGLRTPEPLAGAIALSGYLPLETAAATERTEASRRVAFFLGHGTQDPVVLHARGRAAFERLIGWGYQAEWHEYPMPHSVCAEEIAAISRWLQLLPGLR